MNSKIQNNVNNKQNSNSKLLKNMKNMFHNNVNIRICKNKLNRKIRYFNYNNTSNINES